MSVLGHIPEPATLTVTPVGAAPVPVEVFGTAAPGEAAPARSWNAVTGQRVALPPGKYLVQLAVPAGNGGVTRTGAVEVDLSAGENLEISPEDSSEERRQMLNDAKAALTALLEAAPQVTSAMRQIGSAAVDGVVKVFATAAADPRTPTIAALVLAAASRAVPATTWVGRGLQTTGTILGLGLAAYAARGWVPEGVRSIARGLGLERPLGWDQSLGKARAIVIGGLTRSHLVAAASGRTMPTLPSKRLSLAIPEAPEQGIPVSAPNSVLLLSDGTHWASALVPVDASGETIVTVRWPEAAPDHPGIALFPEVGLTFADPRQQCLWASLHAGAFQELLQLATGQAALASEAPNADTRHNTLAFLLGAYVLLRGNDLKGVEAQLERLEGDCATTPDVVVLRAEIAARRGKHDEALEYLLRMDDSLPRFRLCIDYALQRLRGYVRLRRGLEDQFERTSQLADQFATMAGAVDPAQYCPVLQVVASSR